MKLKTLKDFTDKECYCWFPSFYLDLEDKCKKKRAIPEDLLKAEAVKWVKHFESDNEKGDLTCLAWIKHFFNITEEDLK